MKKALLFLGLGIALTSCGNAFCDCDLYEDDYTWDGFAYQLDASNLVAEDTCLDAGILDSATAGGGSTPSYLTVSRVECP